MMRKRLPALLLAALAVALLLFSGSAGAAAGEERVIDLRGSQYAFDPPVIEAQVGDRLRIRFTSTDVVHGVYLDGYELQSVSDPGEWTEIVFQADRAGTFRYRCSMSCGALHPFMIGELRVSRQDAIWRLLGSGLLMVLAGVIWVAAHPGEKDD